jgi:hypothetical protein
MGGSGCSDCSDGTIYCEDCNGNGERSCDECTEEGYNICTNCEDGWTEDENGAEVRCVDECDDGTFNCEECDSEGMVTCDTCSEGRIDCDNCRSTGQTPAWGYDSVCHDYILEKLVPLGLAKPIEEGERYDHSNKFKPTGALVFSKFYNDMSVDSEWTFTLGVNEPEAMMLLPRMLEIFKELGEAIGGQFDTAGAGMHMAFLHGENALYPVPVPSGHAQHTRYGNFKKSMSLLMPALFFLGSSSEISRPLRFRQPGVISSREGGGKYWAVNMLRNPRSNTG